MLKLAICWSFLLTGLIGAMIASPDFRNRVLAIADPVSSRPPTVRPIMKVSSATAPAAAPAIRTPAFAPEAEAGQVLLPTPVPTPAMPVVITPNFSADHDHAAARRRRDGHFYFDAAVNGAHLEMMFDTGASWVTLRAEDAARAGIDPATLRYTLQTNTANGIAVAAPVTIAVLTVGNITRHDVPAIVSPPGRLNVNLLGQSFLRRAGGYRQEGDELVLMSSQ